MCAVESDRSAQFTSEEMSRLEAIWTGGVQVKSPDCDKYEVWCTGLGPAMTFTKEADGKIVVTDLIGEFMASGTNLQEVILAVLAILKLDLSDIQDRGAPEREPVDHRRAVQARRRDRAGTRDVGSEGIGGIGKPA